MLELPPWSNNESWRQICHYFETTLENRQEFAGVDAVVTNIAEKYTQVEDTLQSLCRKSCCTCLDTCCRCATVWFDFRDLLFQLFHTGELPRKTDNKAG